MNPDKVRDLHIADRGAGRSASSFWLIALVVIAVTALVAYFAWPRAENRRRIVDTRTGKKAGDAATNAASSRALSSGAAPSNAVLTVSGYIINRERIELKIGRAHV